MKRKLGLQWAVAAALSTGLVAWLSADVLALPRDLFLIPYAAAACILTTVFLRSEHVDWRAGLLRNPLRTTIVATLTASVAIATVLLQPGAPRSQGAQLAFELAWSGVIYGAIDGLLLTVVPIVSVARARGLDTWSSRALALAASIGVFIVYHLGFPEFRGPRLGAPVVAGIIFGAAYLIARNPLAPIVAHAAMHVVAVMHGPAGTLQLPPHY
jgi:membrane protease YdiL (CAAX protease family)